MMAPPPAVAVPQPPPAVAVPQPSPAAAVKPPPSSTPGALAWVRPKISLKRPAMRAKLRATLTFSGSVVPKRAGVKVSLQCQRGCTWVTRKTGKTSAAGTFRLRLK